MPLSVGDLAHLEGDYHEFLGQWQSPVEGTLGRLADRGVSRELWAGNGALWSNDQREIAEIEDRLGWLDLPVVMEAAWPGIESLALALRAEGMRRAVLMGMGGSSLAPEVFSEVFGSVAGALELVVLDSTDPAQIRRIETESDLAHTVFVASSKSGTTPETRTLLEYFRSRLQALVGDRWPRHVIAISDPGTPLLSLAADEGFRAFDARADVGGRYSALTHFGLVPAALLGIDGLQLLANAGAMAVNCGPGVPVAANTAVRLGAVMGTLALAGRDKLTLVTSPRWASYGWWAEQLVAESTGKNGTGILPVEGEPPMPPEAYGNDRVVVYVRDAGDDNAATDTLVAELSSHGHPVVVEQIRDPYNLSGEFFRWEMATAVAGVVLGINPFDQPNVEEAKAGAREALADYERSGVLTEAEPVLVEGGLSLYGEPAEATDAVAYVRGFLRQARPGDFYALMAYLDRTPQHADRLQAMRRTLTEALHRPTTVGFGPRFLHSTGQYHKGGTNNGLFIQLTQADAADLAIPGRGYTFGVLKRAQAAGDMAALLQRGRRVLRIQMGTDALQGLESVLDLIRDALA